MRPAALFAVLALAALPGCGASAGPPGMIAYGRQACDHCHMTIAEPQYAAQLVTRTGKVYAFDDAGCLALFYRDGQVDPGAVAGLWVNDFFEPARRLRADSARYVHSVRLHTPMGSGLAAVSRGAEADSLRRLTGGEVLTWAEVLRLPAPHPSGPDDS